MNSPVRYQHWTHVVSQDWRWRNFSPKELACRGTGSLLVNPHALDALQRLRERLGKPIIITSAYRSPEHNRRIKGAQNSRHLAGDAFDVSMANHDPDTFERAARAEGFTGFGFYPKSNFMHIDMGRERQWGTRFPVAAPEFSPETSLPEDLHDSRTMMGSGVAAVGGLGAIAQATVEIEKAENAFSAGGIFGFVIGCLVLAGALYALYARWDDAGRPLPWRKP
jgi:zinc D-Ala-D-Ala carboxypeptidase